MDESRVNTNGEINGWATAEENQSSPSDRRGSFPLPIQTNRGLDLQSLDSSFSRLSVRNQQVSLPDYHRRNRSSSLHSGGIDNGGRIGGGGGYSYRPPSRDFESQQIQNHLQTPSSLYNGGINGGGIGGGGGDGYSYPPPPPRESESLQIQNHLQALSSLYNGGINGNGGGIGGGNGYLYPPPPLPSQQFQNPFQRSSSLHNHPINGGAINGNGGNFLAGGGGGGRYMNPPPLPPLPPSQQIQNPFQRSSFHNDSINGDNAFAFASAFGYNPNPTTRDVPYLSRNQISDPSSPWRLNNNGYDNPMNDLSPSSSIVSRAKDRVYSLQLQNQILEGSEETIDRLFDDLILHAFDLIVDPFGNGVIQSLIEKCSSQQINQILDLVTQNSFRFVAICNDSLGTRVIQLLLRCISSEEQVSRAVEAISKVVLTLTRSNHAKHAILQCFSLFSPLQNRSLIEIIVGNCYRIAIDQHGCCMLQQCLTIGCDELKQRLIGEIITNALRLCVHCYGNYVVQYVVELNHIEVTKELINTLIGNYAYLSRNKYGSHAVQKLLKIKDIDSRLIVNDLLREIDTLLLDPFGNYVIQTAWFVSQDDIKHRLWLHIMSNCGYMRCNKFGKKILEKLYYHRNM